MIGLAAMWLWRRAAGLATGSVAWLGGRRISFGAGLSGLAAIVACALVAWNLALRADLSAARTAAAGLETALATERARLSALRRPQKRWARRWRGSRKAWLAPRC